MGGGMGPAYEPVGFQALNNFPNAPIPDYKPFEIPAKPSVTAGWGDPDPLKKE